MGAEPSQLGGRGSGGSDERLLSNIILSQSSGGGQRWQGVVRGRRGLHHAEEKASGGQGWARIFPGEIRPGEGGPHPEVPMDVFGRGKRNCAIHTRWARLQRGSRFEYMERCTAGEHIFEQPIKGPAFPSERHHPGRGPRRSGRRRSLKVMTSAWGPTYIS